MEEIRKRTPKIQDAAGKKIIHLTKKGDPGWPFKEAIPLGSGTEGLPLCLSLIRL